VTSNDLTSKPNTKQLFTLLKHSKQDSASVAPLHKHNSVHQDDPTIGSILNEQFQSVFSRKYWCRQIHARHYSHIQGIEKLLSNLNPHKAAGPDQIKPIILKKTFDPTITNPKTYLPKVARLGNLTTNLDGC